MVVFSPQKNLMSTRAETARTSREAALEVEVAKLKSRNSRLGKAMLSLVTHIERKLPFLGNKAPVLVAEEKNTAKDQRADNPIKAGQSWKPAVLVQEKAGEALLKKQSSQLAARHPTDSQSIETEVIIFGDTAPALTPPEIEILKSPTQIPREPEPPTVAENRTGSEETVARETKKTSAQMAADAYEAVALVATKVPQDASGDEAEEEEAPYRVAMRKRVNRLRW